MSNEYPKRGDDCEYTIDCMWGMDGWCDRPSDRKCVIADMEARRGKETALLGQAKCQDNEYILCPFCAEKLTEDLWEYFNFGEVARIECPECKKTFIAKAEYSVLYSTEPLEGWESVTESEEATEC